MAFKKGHKLGVTHGMKGTRPYSIWQAMRNRCNNKNGKDYKHYGGRGITIDPRWDDFEVFWAEMRYGYRDALEIDRKENDKGYYKDNCRWATRSEQVNNTRRCHLITIGGETLNISQWARKTGTPRDRIKSRIFKLGWSEEEAVLGEKRVNQFG